MNEPSVIQTTAAQHDALCERTVDLCRDHAVLTAHTMPSIVEQEAYLRGVREGWRFATFAILRDGNCRFEKE